MAYTTNWQTVDPIIGVQPIAETSTTQNHSLGMRVKAKDSGSNNNGEGEFVYAKGVASTVAGMVVVINEDDYSTILNVADSIGQLGVAMSANVASQYGWYQRVGKAVVKVAGNVVDNALVYLAGAGLVDDAVVPGDRIKKAKFASAQDVPATGFAEVEIDNPWADDASAA